MKASKSHSPEVGIGEGAASPLDELLPEPPPKLMALLTKAERNQLLYWLWADAGATPRALLAWPGWKGAFERRNATANPSWAHVEELIRRLHAVTPAPPTPRT